MRLTAPWGRRILALLCLAQTAMAADASPEPADLPIRSATIIDVRDGTLIPDRSIVIRGREIVAVGPGDLGRRYTAAHTVDAAGRFVIPGLWEHACAFRRRQRAGRREPGAVAALRRARCNHGP